MCYEGYYLYQGKCISIVLTKDAKEIVGTVRIISRVNGFIQIPGIFITPIVVNPIHIMEYIRVRKLVALYLNSNCRLQDVYYGCILCATGFYLDDSRLCQRIILYSMPSKLPGV